MDQEEKTPAFDLEERTFQFAKIVRSYVKKVSRSLANIEDSRQLIRASGSVGANYIEANEALGQKDFLMHLKISRKEAKESRYFLRLLDSDGLEDLEAERTILIQEAKELTCIFSAIITKIS